MVRTATLTGYLFSHAEPSKAKEMFGHLVQEVQSFHPIDHRK
jgi:hypothetical protein